MSELDRFRLDGRVALIPGGGGAIGTAMATALAGAGARVAIVDVTQDRVDASADTQADNVSMLVQRVAGASMSEIDNVIEELRSMREYLRSEGERVQREIAGYATVSQTAAASMKVIAESMAQWRSASGSPTPPPFRG